MHIEPLNLSHQKLLENKFRRLNLFLAEYSFANLYLFRELHRYEVIECEEEIFIKGIARDGASFLMPTSELFKLSPNLLQKLSDFASIFFPIPESWIHPLTKRIAQMSFKEEDSDYLFTRSKLAFFPGRHLSAKRNLVKQLFKTHQIRTIDLDSRFDDAQQILEQWKQELREAIRETDYTACQEALQNFHPLHLHGRIIYIDESPAAFSIGEWITSDCYAIHFSKASRSIKGLYQYLYQDLAQSLAENCSWINLEQDLGIPGIRHTKHSYLPDQLLHKWRVEFC